MNQFLRTVDISKSIFDVVYEGAKDTFPDLSTLSKTFFLIFFYFHTNFWQRKKTSFSLDISNVLSGANTSVVETGVNPVMYIPPQNMQPVNEQVVAYDAYVSHMLINFKDDHWFDSCSQNYRAVVAAAVADLQQPRNW